MLLSLIDRRLGIALAVLFAVIVLVPLGNQFAERGTAFHVPSYVIPLLGRYLCFALLAVALDLVWGYCGILSLGHGAFFALGGYAMGMHLMREVGTRGVYASELPDFMVFLGYTELPWFWWGFGSFPFAAFMALAVPGVLAFVFGWFAFRSRVNGVYLSIITQALTFALMLAFFRNEMGFGGNNGLTGFRDVLGYSLSSNDTRIVLFVLSGLALAFGLLLGRWITTSRFGKVLLAVRDAESRTRFLGYKVEGYKLFVFTVSAMLAGLAGALYVPQIGIINPGEFSPAQSIEIAIWVAVGGRGTLVGAILGAVVVNLAKTWLTGAAPELWLFFLGGLFVTVTLFLPRGQRSARGRPCLTRAAACSRPGGMQPRPPPPHGRSACSISTASPSASTGSRR
jgi:urea transport system permease protein